MGLQNLLGARKRMSQDYRIEMQKEDAFMTKYKPMTLHIVVHYMVDLEPEEYAEYQDGKPIITFDHWQDNMNEVEVISESPTE